MKLSQFGAHFSHIVLCSPLQWSVGGVLSKMTGGGGREGNSGASSMTPAQTLSAIAASPSRAVPSETKPENEGSTQLQV